MTECMTPDKVQEAFLAAPPLIAQQILDLTIKHPNWLRDQFETEQWPTGSGTIMEQLVFRGALPQIERGLDQWRKIPNTSGCSPCDSPDCSYNWTPLGGHGFERKLTELAQREFRSPSYCINEIQTTANFKQVFAKIVENLYRQIDFFKEVNIGQNVLTLLAKKCMVDAGGAKFNPQNPYVYRNTGGVRLSTLNIEMLEFFYEHMRRLPDAIPYDVVDGAPIYAVVASHQLLARMFRDNANIRQDVRFSGAANDLLTKYNFMSTTRGMFINVPILYPRRFDVVAGVPVEVLPFVNDVPAEVGAFTYLNPAYEAAAYEEVLIHGKFPFKLFYMPTEQTLGEGATFGPEDSFMNSFMWVNPQTVCDPFRRVGFFATAAKMGVGQQFSDGIYGVLVERPRVALMAMYTPEPECPPETVTCDNIVPSVECPCPVVVSITASPFTSGNYIFVLATPVTGAPGHTVSFRYDNGTCVDGELVQISSDGKTIEVDIDLCDGVCENIIGLCCSTPQVPCSARVISASDCAGVLTVVLSNAIRASVGERVTAYSGDCLTSTLEIVSIDPCTLTYTLQFPNLMLAAQPNEVDVLCQVGGIYKICVPPETDATCPACEASLDACDEHVIHEL